MDGSGIHSMQGFDPADDQKAFRSALGTFATGVTIVTVPSEDGPIGITANSFASVSLDPPLVLWSPAKASGRYKYFRHAPRFAIHVLDGHQKDVCNGFAKDWSCFDGLDWAEDIHGVPCIEGCLARFDCTQYGVHDAGDHVIIVGKVRSARYRDGMPLLFQGGKFVSVKG